MIIYLQYYIIVPVFASFRFSCYSDFRLNLDFFIAATEGCWNIVWVFRALQNFPLEKLWNSTPIIHCDSIRKILISWTLHFDRVHLSFNWIGFLTNKRRQGYRLLMARSHSSFLLMLVLYFSLYLMEWHQFLGRRELMETKFFERKLKCWEFMETKFFEFEYQVSEKRLKMFMP